MDINGVSLNEATEDMKGIMVYVTNTSPIPVTFDGLEEFLSKFNINSLLPSGGSLGSKYAADTKSSVKINLDPQPSDFTSFGGDLSKVIPHGFLLLHNDLMSFLEKKDKSNESGGESFGGLLGGLSAAGATGLGATLGGAVGGFVGGTLGGLFTGLFGDATSRHMEDIIDELNQDLTADDFRNNEEVKQVQVEGFIEYLKAYYTQQRNALYIEGTGESLGKALAGIVTTAITETFKGLWNAITGKQEEPDKLAAIAQELTAEITSEPFLSGGEYHDELKEVQNKAVMNYLKAYYAMQISEMVAQGAGNTTGNFIGNALNGVLTGMFEGTIGNVLRVFGVDTSNGEDFAASLEKIVVELHNRINVEDFANSEEVLAVQRDSVIEYLKAYYKVQLNSLISDNSKGWIESLATDFGKSIPGFFKGLLGIEDEDNSQIAKNLKDAINQISSQPIVVSNLEDAGLFSADSEFATALKDLYGNLLTSTAKAIQKSFDKDAFGGIYDDWNPFTNADSDIKKNIATPIANEVLRCLKEVSNTKLTQSDLSTAGESLRGSLRENLLTAYGKLTNSVFEKIQNSFDFNVYIEDNTFADARESFEKNLVEGVFTQLNDLSKASADSQLGFNVESVNLNSSYNDANLLSRLDTLENSMQSMIQLLTTISQASDTYIPIPTGSASDSFGDL